MGKREGKKPLGRRRHMWEGTIKMDLKGIGWLNSARVSTDHLAFKSCTACNRANVYNSCATSQLKVWVGHSCGILMIRFAFLFNSRHKHFQPAHFLSFQNWYAYFNTSAYCNVTRLTSVGVTRNPFLDASFPPCFKVILCPAFARLDTTGSMSKAGRSTNATVASDRAQTSFLYFSIAFLKLVS
jgi:hypothetical protein